MTDSVNETTAQKRNTITRADFFRLCDWMRKNADLVASNESLAAVNASATTALATTFSNNAIKDALDATGLTLAPPRRKADVNDKIAIIAKSMVLLLRNAGVPVARELEEIATTQGTLDAAG